MTHTWKINNVERLTENGLITRIDYYCSSEHSGHDDSTHGESHMEGDASSSSFIAYGDLTELQILDWVYAELESNENKLSKSLLEEKHSTSIIEMINLLATIPDSSSGVPWNSTEE
jgi:hypothetical protein